MGLVLAILGGIGLVVDSVAYDDQETVLELGSFEASATVEKRLRIPPWAAGAVLAAGVGVILFGATREP